MKKSFTILLLIVLLQVALHAEGSKNDYYTHGNFRRAHNKRSKIDPKKCHRPYYNHGAYQPHSYRRGVNAKLAKR